MKRKLLLALGCLVGLATLFYGGYVWYNAITYVSTDDAYVDGTISPVSAKVAGHIVELRVQDNQLVKNGDPPTIMTDGDRVLQVITNLLANALHWTPDGGQIEVGVDTSNGSVSVDIADSGPGITPEHQERIFRPFVSGDTEGTGLGLPIARELARALGGRVELESAVGRGSRFRLVLPAPPV